MSKEYTIPFTLDPEFAEKLAEEVMSEMQELKTCVETGGELISREQLMKKLEEMMPDNWEDTPEEKALEDHHLKMIKVVEHLPSVSFPIRLKRVGRE